jgi:hypothetical protein
MAGIRKSIPAATQAALWAVSSGQCYCPNCPNPVLFETRPGVFQKNSQIVHIYGVKPGTPRYREYLTDEERDSFANLLVLCLAHHAEIDHEATGEELYPAELLRSWKTEHEGRNGRALAHIRVDDPDKFMDELAALFESPITRLEALTEQLEEAGQLTAQTINELRQITAVLAAAGPGPDARTARALAYAAEVFQLRNLDQAATRLAYAAETLDVAKLNAAANRLSNAADQVRHLR